ncbi:transposase [Micromonospora rubida]|uniref:Transposase n=1 Tax=Micromonospora rubida TaxID=2697657 RepID=A0ABW7SN28_9ACTN
MATDTLGLLLAVIVTAASVQDSTAGRHVLDTVSTDHPTVSKAWVDGGYNTAVRAHGARLGVDVVPRPAGKGFPSSRLDLDDPTQNGGVRHILDARATPNAPFRAGWARACQARHSC